MFNTDEEIPPMGQDKINTFPLIKYRPHKDDYECIIYMVEFVQDQDLKILPCGHFYHGHCIDDWLKRKAICPKC